tara:strand:+ start:3718 stop:4122 length:405 start_codon:yes stop_codon:yes gene_type:complete
MYFQEDFYNNNNNLMKDNEEVMDIDEENNLNIDSLNLKDEDLDSEEADFEEEYEYFTNLFSNYLDHKTKKGPLGVENDKDIYTYFYYFMIINNSLKNKNINIENYEKIEDYYDEVDNLFMEIYEININSMIQYE